MERETGTSPREDPWPEDFDPESIDHDESLILSMLEKTPAERLALAQGFANSVRILRRGRRGPVSRHSHGPHAK